ncbi:RdRP-domain-containing protein [Choiromyces venosus 120613-1]|uniref:RNA-directed RNA polymerase n=1 Tax=Choiromyces venosus 120613-1 TaxID=1336337 RepID=A0A3N4K424_9PEZI|nr:RdRP-domain-containing protein [Choiromyces venosus 120613-1]
MAPPVDMSHHRAGNVLPTSSSGSTLNPRANPYLAVSPVPQMALLTQVEVQQTATSLEKGDQPTQSTSINTVSRSTSLRTAPLRGNPISSRRGYPGPAGRGSPARPKNNDESHRRISNSHALPMLTSLPTRIDNQVPRSVTRNPSGHGDVARGYPNGRDNGRPSYNFNSHPNRNTNPKKHSSGRNTNSTGSGINMDNNSHSIRGLPILRQSNWNKPDERSIKISNIPLSLDLHQLYTIFSNYGEVESLELFQNDSGISDGNGRVRLSNVETPFWEEPFTYSLGVGSPTGSLTLRLEYQYKPKMIQSPIDRQKSYPQKYVFKLSLLQFGILYQEDTMIPMFTTTDTDEASLEVDLHRRALDIVFKIWLEKDNSTSTSTNQLQEESKEVDEYDDDDNNTSRKLTDRYERYRFRIPFSHLEQLIEVETSSTSGPGRAFVIDLPSAPFFWRKLHDPLLSIDDRMKFWTSWNAWFRQTSIAFDNSKRNGLPVTLEQRGGIINIGRWTTYRFEVGANEAKSDGFNELISAMKDFNIKINVQKDFKTLPKKKVDPIWDYIDTRRNQDSNYSLDQLHQASPPLLSYEVRYQLEVCISHNCLNEYNITPQFIDRLAELPGAKAIPLLEHVAEKRVRYYDPMDIFTIQGVARSTIHLKLPDHCQLLRKANVTPSTVYFTTPTVEITNRVVRQYSEHIDRFLRVQFVDEKFQGRINSTDKKTMHEVFTRVKTALDHGITIGDRKFEFLAFGNSQIREHGAYFFASTEHVSAADIRAWMGSFRNIRVVAKHAARLGQCFSTTRAISGVRVDVRSTEDIVNDEGYNFSDGVGKISEFLALLITTELRLKLVDKEPAPSCFQFRLGGRKGVLAVSPDTKDREVYIRPSQLKFEAKHNILEVIRWSKFATAALNRQLIIVLTSLGAPDRYFEDKLQFMLKSYEKAMVDPGVAVGLLCKNVDPNESTLAIAAMIRAGFMDRQEPFVMSMLKLWRAWTIKYLKEKAKIMIEEGAFVLGVVDETGILDGYYYSQDEKSTEDTDNLESSLPQIFLQVTNPDLPGESRVIEGPCIIARNPSLHPGDVRKVMAVNIKELHHLRNVVVFSQKGDRDLPNMLSGGDLDGDDYIVIWDEKLTSRVSNYEPMNYSAQPPRELARDVEIGDITKFFVNYMKNDKLGTIANAHLAWADKHDEGVKSDECFRLAILHSHAVDYVKSGEPAIMPPELRRKTFPHFMEKEPEKTYRSDKILGVLYDSVSKIDFVPAFELEFDDRILNAYTLDENILEPARTIKIRYDAAMRRIMAQHDIYTEFEVISTFIMHHSMATNDYKFHEDIANSCDGLKDTFKKIIYEVVASKDDIILGPFIAAMYSVTHQEMVKAKKKFFAAKAKIAAKRAAKRANGNEKAQEEGKIPAHAQDLEELAEFSIEEARNMPLISFPWLFGRTLGRIANREYPFKKLDGSTVDFKPAATVTDELEGRMGKKDKHATYRHGIYDDAVATTTPGIRENGNDIPDILWNGESILGKSQGEANSEDVTTIATDNINTPTIEPDTTTETSLDYNTRYNGREDSLI